MAKRDGGISSSTIWLLNTTVIHFRSYRDSTISRAMVKHVACSFSIYSRHVQIHPCPHTQTPDMLGALSYICSVDDGSIVILDPMQVAFFGGGFCLVYKTEKSTCTDRVWPWAGRWKMKAKWRCGVSLQRTGKRLRLNHPKPGRGAQCSANTLLKIEWNLSSSKHVSTIKRVYESVSPFSKVNVGK